MTDVDVSKIKVGDVVGLRVVSDDEPLADVKMMRSHIERFLSGHAYEWWITRAEARTILAALTDPRQPSEGWRPIESAPRDGTEFIATVRVFSNSAFSHHDMHIVAVDDETGELANHYEQGWRIEDYEFWRPLPPAPPTGGPQGEES